MRPFDVRITMIHRLIVLFFSSGKSLEEILTFFDTWNHTSLEGKRALLQMTSRFLALPDERPEEVLPLVDVDLTYLAGLAPTITLSAQNVWAIRQQVNLRMSGGGVGSNGISTAIELLHQRAPLRYESLRPPPKPTRMRKKRGGRRTSRSS
jgi:hypothetical protein